MTQHHVPALVSVIATRLANPDTAPAGRRSQAWWPQSLAHGVPGIALLHIELAAAGLAPWQRAHDWLTAATRTPVTSGADSHPCYGAPALAHALACASGQLPGSYQRAIDTLDQQIVTDTRRRLAAAHARIDRGDLPALAEFDALQGITGYGSYLMRRHHDDAVRAVLEYLVRLAEPLTISGEALPGWWTQTGPSGRADGRFPGGHANHGLAHGAAGILSLLSLAARQGITVHRQQDAIRAICAWLDRWAAGTDRGAAWPYWVTRAELRAGKAAPPPALRPSWCYGTAGVARAQQLAALALGDTDRQLRAEIALAGALTDPRQLAATTDISLCHGFAGMAHITACAAAEARPSTAGRLHSLLPGLLSAVTPPGTDPEHTAAALLGAADRGPGLLDGAAGIALALLTASAGTPPRTAWDACLLIR